jgi:hypothetical protein
MALTMSGAVCPARRERLGTQVAYLFGTGCGAFSTYVVLRGIVEAVAPANTGAFAVLVLVSIWAVLRDALGRAIPVPYLNRQVPEWFRSVLPLQATGFAFGGLLGLGFVTKFTYGLHMAVMVGLALYVPPLSALVAIVSHSLFRLVNTLVTYPTPHELAEVFSRWSRRRWLLRLWSAASTSALLLAAWTAH